MIIRLSLFILGCISGCKSCNNLIINLICGAGGFGLLINLLVGIIGGLLGGWVFGLLGIATGGILGSLITSVVGAVLLLWIVSLFRRHPNEG